MNWNRPSRKNPQHTSWREGKATQTIGRHKDNIKDKHEYGQPQTKCPHSTSHVNTQHDGTERQHRRWEETLYWMVIIKHINVFFKSFGMSKVLRIEGLVFTPFDVICSNLFSINFWTFVSNLDKSRSLYDRNLFVFVFHQNIERLKSFF